MMMAQIGSSSAPQRTTAPIQSWRSPSISVVLVAASQIKVAAAQYELTTKIVGKSNASQTEIHFPPFDFATSIEASTGGYRLEIPKLSSIQTRTGVATPLPTQI